MSSAESILCLSVLEGPGYGAWSMLRQTVSISELYVHWVNMWPGKLSFDLVGKLRTREGLLWSRLNPIGKMGSRPLA